MLAEALLGYEALAVEEDVGVAVIVVVGIVAVEIPEKGLRILDELVIKGVLGLGLGEVGPVFEGRGVAVFEGEFLELFGGEVSWSSRGERRRVRGERKRWRRDGFGGGEALAEVGEAEEGGKAAGVGAVRGVEGLGGVIGGGGEVEVGLEAEGFLKGGEGSTEGGAA